MRLDRRRRFGKGDEDGAILTPRTTCNFETELMNRSHTTRQSRHPSSKPSPGMWHWGNKPGIGCPGFLRAITPGAKGWSYICFVFT